MMSAKDRGDDGGDSTPIVDLASGIVMTLLAIWALNWLIPNNMDMTAGNYDVAPSFLPNLSAWVVLGLGLLLTLTAGGRWLKARRAPADEGLSAARQPSWLAISDPVGWAIACVLIYLGFRWLGFLVIAPIVLVAGMWFAGQRSWLVMAAMAVLFPVVVKYASWAIFFVDLP